MGYDMFVQGAPADAEHTYLRRSIWGMGPTREALAELAMVFDSTTPELPEAAHLTAQDFTDDGQPATEPARLFLADLERVLSQHSPADGDYLIGIPGHKLCSNDEWHVTSQEAAEALASYETFTHLGKPHPESFADDVLPFLRSAARYEGFRVY